jgi:hypothetical protein
LGKHTERKVTNEIPSDNDVIRLEVFLHLWPTLLPPFNMVIVFLESLKFMGNSSHHE